MYYIPIFAYAHAHAAICIIRRCERKNNNRACFPSFGFARTSLLFTSSLIVFPGKENIEKKKSRKYCSDAHARQQRGDTLQGNQRARIVSRSYRTCDVRRSDDDYDGNRRSIMFKKIRFTAPRYCATRIAARQSFTLLGTDNTFKKISFISFNRICNCYYY